MTSKLVCPFCGEELRQSKYIEPLTGQNLYFCDTHDCYPTECVIGTQSMWQVLIQAKQDLEIATKALEEISSHYQDEMGNPTFVDWYLSAKKMCDCADKALETIGKHNE